MTISMRTIISGRIKTANKHSRIAVLKTDEPGLYDAVFADTVAGHRLMNRCPANLMGIYFGHVGVAAFAKKMKEIKR